MEEGIQVGIHVENEKLTMHRSDAKSTSVSLIPDILEKDDIHGFLLWATFFRIHRLAVVMEKQLKLGEEAVAKSAEMSSPDAIKAMMANVMGAMDKKEPAE